MTSRYGIDVTGEVHGWTPPVRTGFVAVLATLGVAPAEPYPSRHARASDITLPNGKTVHTPLRETWNLPTANIAGRPGVTPHGMYDQWREGKLAIDTVDLFADAALVVAGLCAQRNREALLLQKRHGSAAVPLVHILSATVTVGGSPVRHVLSGYRRMTPADAARDSARSLPPPDHLVRVGPEHGPHWLKRVYALAAVGFPAAAKNGHVLRDSDGAFRFPRVSLADPALSLDDCLRTAAMIDEFNARVMTNQIVRGVENALPGYPPGNHPFHIAYQSLHTFDQLVSVMRATPRTLVLHDGASKAAAIVREDAPEDELRAALKHTRVSLSAL